MTRSGKDVHRVLQRDRLPKQPEARVPDALDARWPKDPRELGREVAGKVLDRVFQRACPPGVSPARLAQ